VEFILKYSLTVIFFAIAFLILYPFVAIWSLNVIFPSLEIPYDFYTWLAMIILLTFFGRATPSVSKK
jgi:hypothetical protein